VMAEKLDAVVAELRLLNGRLGEGKLQA
jgi:hypothetical protein